MGGTYGRNNRVEPVIFSLDKTPGAWQNVQINVKTDFEKNLKGMKYDDVRPEKLVISIGTWNVNDAGVQPFAAWFTNFELNNNPGNSNINGVAIALAPDEEKWWRGKLQPSVNIAGEHHYHTKNRKNLTY